MVTKEEALTSNEFHYGTCALIIGPRGGTTLHRILYRRNGKTRTWKTRPLKWSVPTKQGLYDYHTIRSGSAVYWHTAEACPIP